MDVRPRIADGGAVVIARSAWVGLLIYVFALAQREGVDPDGGPHFDRVRAPERLAEHVPSLMETVDRIA